MDKLEEVKKLKQLLDDGIIDENDFAQKKAEILGISKTEEVKTETVEATSEKEFKSKSLDDYEKELIEQAKKDNIDANAENSENQSDENYYKHEKLKAKAKLDAKEEIRKQRMVEQKEVVNKGLSKIARLFKWILAIFLWLIAIGSFGTASQSGFIYIPIGIVMLALGCMACPKITDITQKKYEAYTMHKTAIVWILIIVLFILIVQ